MAGHFALPRNSTHDQHEVGRSGSSREEQIPFSSLHGLLLGCCGARMFAAGGHYFEVSLVAKQDESSVPVHLLLRMDSALSEYGVHGRAQIK
jgi:hypothetical protein